MGTTAEKLAYLDATKTAIKDAIVSNGIDVPDDTTFRSYPDKVNQIVGQFDSTLDEIIGGEIVPVLDVEKRLATVNGISGDINTQLDTLDSTKAAIASAITEKGVEIPEGTPFGEYAGLIQSTQSKPTYETFIIPAGTTSKTYNVPLNASAFFVYGKIDPFSMNEDQPFIYNNQSGEMKQLYTGGKVTNLTCSVSKSSSAFTFNLKISGGYRVDGAVSWV